MKFRIWAGLQRLQKISTFNLRDVLIPDHATKWDRYTATCEPILSRTTE